MGIDYAITLGCEPKRRFGEDGLYKRLVRLTLGRESGALEAAFELRPLAFHCAGCPANHSSRDFGCHGTLSLPLSAAAEEWLISRLPASLKLRKHDESGAAERQVAYVRHLQRRLQRAGMDGRAAELLLRARGRLVRPRPAERVFGSLLRRERITSSQLLELLLLDAEIFPETAEILCLALGIWDENGSGKEGPSEVLFTEPAEASDDPSVAELKQLLYALTVACSLNVPLALLAGEGDLPPPAPPPR